MKKKHKILLPKLKNVSSTDADILLNIDISSTFSEFKKERYDNDLDLSIQFQKERDLSRNFMIYGEISSVTRDCDNLQIQVYTDSGYTNFHTSIMSTPISYKAPNVAGKKNGKYLVKLVNYQFDEVYFLIQSDNFTYKDQAWSNKLVFYDTEGQFVSYGTETIEVDSNNNIIEINNNFPFFFNKHWVRNDYSIESELIREISFNTGYTQIIEGQSGFVNISLNKESSFGIESCTLDIEDLSDSTPYFNSYVFDTANGTTVFEASSIYPQLSGFSVFFITIQPEYLGQFAVGSSVKIINGQYIGVYTIFDIFTPNALFPDQIGVVLDCQFNNNFNNSFQYKIKPNNQIDLDFELNGIPTQFPIQLNWAVNETSKQLSFTAKTDFEVEFTENFNISIFDKSFLVYGDTKETEISIINNTEKRYVHLDFGKCYQNRAWFTGRTVNNTNIESMSILRNGLYYENRNEEFYPCDEFNIKIKNNGIRTLIPENDSLSIVTPIRIESEQEVEFLVKPMYGQDNLHEIELNFSGIPQEFATQITGLTHSGEIYYSIDGTRFNAYLNQSGYDAFKIIFSQNVDPYSQFSVNRPYDVTFDDNSQKAIIKAKTPATRLDFYTNDPRIQVVTKTAYIYPDQKPFILSLLANSEQNTKANYEITISKNSYKDLKINTNLNAYNTDQDYYLTLCMSDVMAPYYKDLGAPYHYSSSTFDDISNIVSVLNNQQTFMPKEAVLVNGIFLLSSGIIPYSRENLTNYGNSPIYTSAISGLSSDFTAQFLSNKLSIIDQTNEELVTSQTKKVVELKIDSIGLGAGADLSQERVVEFQIGEIGNQTVYKFGGSLIDSNVVSRADSWWNNAIKTRDGNYVDLIPYYSMRERLDTGNSNIPQGFLTGKVKEQFQNTLIITPKLDQTPFYVIIEQDIDINLSGLPDLFMSVREMSKQLITGQHNLGNNHLGGFAFSL